MLYGFSICQDARSAVTAAANLASTVRSASIESPEALVRNASYLREQVEAVRECLAAVEAKRPRPGGVRDVQRPAA